MCLTGVTSLVIVRIGNFLGLVISRAVCGPLVNRIMLNFVTACSNTIEYFRRTQNRKSSFSNLNRVSPSTFQGARLIQNSCYGSQLR